MDTTAYLVEGARRKWAIVYASETESGEINSKRESGTVRIIIEQQGSQVGEAEGGRKKESENVRV